MSGQRHFFPESALKFFPFVRFVHPSPPLPLLVLVFSICLISDVVLADPLVDPWVSVTSDSEMVSRNSSKDVPCTPRNMVLDSVVCGGFDFETT